MAQKEAVLMTVGASEMTISLMQRAHDALQRKARSKRKNDRVISKWLKWLNFL